MHRTVRAACVIAALCCAPAHAQEAKLLQKFNDWSAYATSGSAKTCFAVSKPKESLPKGVRRGPIFIYISAYPSDSIKNEVSIKMGYPFAAGAKVAATVGSDKFELFTKDEGAFVEKPATETEFIEAMKKGSQLKVEGTSARGTKTTDNYSLQGFAPALERVAQECNS